jgi:hypothetical protein
MGEKNEITELETLLEINGFLHDELKRYYEMDFSKEEKIQELSEQKKNLLDFVLWVKEAFGHFINEDYFSQTLGEHIDFSLEEYNIPEDEIRSLTEARLKLLNR